MGGVARIVSAGVDWRTVQMRGIACSAILRGLLYFTLPSIVWSLVYREPKIVVDVLPLAVVESLVWRPIACVIRLAWCLLCVSMLLLEWNIFPESYLFYLTLMVRAASFPQGRAIALGLCLLIVFIALPPPRRLSRHVEVSIFAIYAALLGAKAWPVTKTHLIWLRQPAPRALQVAWTDAARIWTVSVAPADYDARSPGHAQLAAWLAAPNRPAKLLVVLLESWGETSADMATLVSNVRRDVPSAEVAGGFTAYAGPTLAGEVRDLCGHILSFSSVDASLADCLPRRALREGYHTAAFHGYDGYFYNRQILYPQIGFMRSWFAPDFGAAERCGGAFDGICDDIVLARAIDRLRAPGRQFVYMMSLSAHEPIAPSLADRSYIRAAPGHALDGRRINEALVRLAVNQSRQIAREGRGDVVLYMAGDHNPPGQEEARGLPPGKVPYLLLRWRS